MEEQNEPMIGLRGIMKLTGILPILLGTTFLLSPKTAIAVGPYLTEHGIFVSMYVGVFAIFIGMTQWFVAIYVKENLHIFGRFFVIGHSLIALLEMYGWATDLIEFEPKYIFGSMFPFATAFVLLMYSLNPEKSEVVDKSEN